jgi:predicted neuraminidase
MIATGFPTSPDAIAAKMNGEIVPYRGRHIAILPSPMVQNHAAFFMRDQTDNLHCVWFAGELEGKADISIYHSTLTSGAKQWGPAIQRTDDPSRSEQNPILFQPNRKHTYLLHTAQPGGDQDRCVVRIREIGERPRDLDLPLGTFVRARPIVRADGAWLLPLFHCVHQKGARWTGRNDYASLAISYDQGFTWRRVDVPQSTGCVHMTVVPLSDSQMVAFFRRRQADYVYRTQSNDGGESWSIPTATNIPNNNSSIAAIQMQDGRICLICNPVNKDMSSERRLSLYDELGEDSRPEANGGCTPVWGVPRAPLIVFFSSDQGATFLNPIEVWNSSGACLSNNSSDGYNQELSYPAISQRNDGDLEIAFTLHRRAIAYVRIPASEFNEAS